MIRSSREDTPLKLPSPTMGRDVLQTGARPSRQLPERAVELFPIGLPKFIAVELTSLCNRDCFFCPRFADDTGKRKDAKGKPIIHSAPTERVYRLIDEAWE